VSIPEDKAMSSDKKKAAPAVNTESRIAPVSFAESHFVFGERLSRHDWDVMLARWEQLQPYGDRFASAFFDTLFAWAPDFRQVFGGASLQAQFIRFAHLLTQIVSATDDRDELEHRIEAVVHRFSRSDSETTQSQAMRAAIAALLDEVSRSAMPAALLVRWKSAYLAVGNILRGTRWVRPRLGALVVGPLADAEAA
jgi:hemoglobin-like flavoprotein